MGANSPEFLSKTGLKLRNTWVESVGNIEVVGSARDVGSRIQVVTSGEMTEVLVVDGKSGKNWICHFNSLGELETKPDAEGDTTNPYSTWVDSTRYIGGKNGLFMYWGTKDGSEKSGFTKTRGGHGEFLVLDGGGFELDQLLAGFFDTYIKDRDGVATAAGGVVWGGDSDSLNYAHLSRSAGMAREFHLENVTMPVFGVLDIPTPSGKQEEFKVVYLANMGADGKKLKVLPVSVNLERNEATKGEKEETEVDWLEDGVKVVSIQFYPFENPEHPQLRDLMIVDFGDHFKVIHFPTKKLLIESGSGYHSPTFDFSGDIRAIHDSGAGKVRLENLRPDGSTWDEVVAKLASTSAPKSTEVKTGMSLEQLLEILDTNPTFQAALDDANFAESEAEKTTARSNATQILDQWLQANAIESTLAQEIRAQYRWLFDASVSVGVGSL